MLWRGAIGINGACRGEEEFVKCHRRSYVLMLLVLSPLFVFSKKIKLRKREDGESNVIYILGKQNVDSFAFCSPQRFLFSPPNQIKNSSRQKDGMIGRNFHVCIIEMTRALRRGGVGLTKCISWGCRMGNQPSVRFTGFGSQCARHGSLYAKGGVRLCNGAGFGTQNPDSRNKVSHFHRRRGQEREILASKVCIMPLRLLVILYAAWTRCCPLPILGTPCCVPNFPGGSSIR